MSEAAAYRENALKIRRLTAGVSGEAAKAALLLASEYEARAKDLDERPAESPHPAIAERVSALVNARSAEIAEIDRRERELIAELATARTERSHLEARIAGILEAASLLDIAADRGAAIQ